MPYFSPKHRRSERGRKSARMQHHHPPDDWQTHDGAFAIERRPGPSHPRGDPETKTNDTPATAEMPRLD